MSASAAQNRETQRDAEGLKGHRSVRGSMETGGGGGGGLQYTIHQMSKWFLRLRGRRPPWVRAYLCDVCKSLAPSMLYAAALVVVVLFALADQLHDFVCRIFIPQYRYPYTAPLALAQVPPPLQNPSYTHQVETVKNRFSTRAYRKEQRTF